MDDEQLLSIVDHQAHVGREGAVRTTRAVLQTLAERLSASQARKLCERLPPELLEWLYTRGGPVPFDVDELLRRVAEREGGDIDVTTVESCPVPDGAPLVRSDERLKYCSRRSRRAASWGYGDTVCLSNGCCSPDLMNAASNNEMCVVPKSQERKPTMGVKVMVMYPPPTDSEEFEKRYLEEHLPMAVEKLGGKTKAVLTKVLGSPQGDPQFVRIAEIHFPSMEALQACASSPGGQETLAHAAAISTGGPPIILIAEDETVTF